VSWKKLTRHFLFNPSLIFYIFFWSPNFGIADELYLKNGDHISGQLISLSPTLCTFQTIYQTTPHLIKRNHISRFKITEPVAVELNTGDRIIATLETNENGIIFLHSPTFGITHFKKEDIVAISRLNTFPSSTDNINQALKVRGQGKTTDKTTSSPKPLGEKPKEDIRQLFLRESTVLLKPFEAELDISVHYAYDKLANFRTRQFSLPVSLRVGLTERLEGFISLPLMKVERETFYQSASDKNNASGIGDFTGGIKYLLVRENRRWPDIIGSFSVIAPTGEEPDPQNSNQVALGTGHWRLSTGVTFIKSFDPAVLFGGIGYLHTFAQTLNGVDVALGKTVSYNFGMGFALNNQLSLSSQFSGVHQAETKFNGIGTGSSREPMSLIMGITYRLAKNQYLNPSVRFGISDDATDAVLNLSYSRTLF